MNQIVEHLSLETVLLEPALMVCVWDKNKWVEFEMNFKKKIKTSLKRDDFVDV